MTSFIHHLMLEIKSYRGIMIEFIDIFFNSIIQRKSLYE